MYFLFLIKLITLASTNLSKMRELADAFIYILAAIYLTKFSFFMIFMISIILEYYFSRPKIFCKIFKWTINSASEAKLTNRREKFKIYVYV